MAALASDAVLKPPSRENGAFDRDLGTKTVLCFYTCLPVITASLWLRHEWIKMNES